MILMILAPLVGVLGAILLSFGAWVIYPLLATLLAVFCACSGHGLYPAPFPVTGKLNPGRVANVFSRNVYEKHRIGHDASGTGGSCRDDLRHLHWKAR